MRAWWGNVARSRKPNLAEDRAAYLMASYPSPDFRCGERPFNLLRLQASGLEHVRHLDRRARGGRQEGRVQSDVADVAAADVELRQQPGREVAGRSLRRKNPAPDH